MIIKNFGYVEGPDIFGDMFGALNVVFTGAVLMLSVYTIYKSSTEGREQLKKQEIEMILNRIDKIHDDFNEENYVTNFIKECRYTEERYVLQKKDYELNYYPKEDRWNTSQRIHDIVKSDISNLLTNKYNNYFEYMKLILYLNEKISGLKEEHNRNVYQTLRSTHFQMHERLAVVIFVVFNIDDFSNNVIRDLASSNAIFTKNFLDYLRKIKVDYEENEPYIVPLECMMYDILNKNRIIRDTAWGKHKVSSFYINSKR